MGDAFLMFRIFNKCSLALCGMLCLSQEEQEEIERMREKVRLASQSSANHAKEAKAMEVRAGQLAAEVERVKMLLLVRIVHVPLLCCLPPLVFSLQYVTWTGGTKHTRVHA
jgi:hypothetical protein